MAARPSAARVQATPAPRWLPVTTLTLSVLGLAVAAYLTFEHFTSSTTLACPETGVVNCAKVTTSSYATVLGMPVAVLGLVFFVAMVALCLPAAWRATSPWLRRGRVAAVSVGAVSVLYLVWVELFAVNAICLWCTAVHVLTLCLFAVVTIGQSMGASRPESG
jgi:uncharacterized membrane protein